MIRTRTEGQMTDMSGAPARALRRFVRFGGTIAVIALATGWVWSSQRSSVVDAAIGSASQYATFQRGLQEFLVTFEFEQQTPTTDQITILFTNAPVNLKVAPNPVFGADIVQEFSFSGRNFPSGRVTFSRRVRDRGFLDCRYIRVVNHGTNRWFPTTISLSIDGQRVLNNVSMYPRSGNDPKGGIERWNPDWNPVFWQGELQRFRPKGS
jgi:hypothetical protein